MAVTELTPKRLDWVESEIRPSLRPCMCGCGEMTKRRFAPGHDAAVRRALEDMADDGNKQAERILVKAGWRPSVARKATKTKTATASRGRRRAAA